MSLTGKGLAEYARSKNGTPYFYGAKFSDGVLTEGKMATMNRMYPSIVTKTYIAKARKNKQVGKVNIDCSGLIAEYREKSLGSSQLYAAAYTRLPIANIKDFAIGTVLWKPGHVGVYLGMDNGVPMCEEAKGIDYGVVETKVANTSWKNGLTFKDIEYNFDKNIASLASWKGENPYKEPTATLKIGSTNKKGVEWLQWELIVAGYGHKFIYDSKIYDPVEIDGDFATITLAAVLSFQSSCKIDVDGIVGEETRKELKLDM